MVSQIPLYWPSFKQAWVPCNCFQYSACLALFYKEGKGMRFYLLVAGRKNIVSNDLRSGLLNYRNLRGGRETDSKTVTQHSLVLFFFCYRAVRWNPSGATDGNILIMILNLSFYGNSNTEIALQISFFLPAPTIRNRSLLYPFLKWKHVKVCQCCVGKFLKM